MSQKPSSTGPDTHVTPWRRRLFVLTSVVVTLSVIARVSIADEPADSQGSPPGATSLVDGQQPPPDAEEPSGMARLLPFITEGGLALLIGLALGAATRTLLRTILMMIILGFVVVQVLAYKGILTVDWGTAFQSIKDFVLNVSPDGGFGTMLKQKIPTVAAFLLGYYLGLKK